MGLCHLQENTLFKRKTQYCIFYGISFGQIKISILEADVQAAMMMMRYHTMYKQIF